MINELMIDDELMINGELINDELMIDGELMINPLVVCRSDGIRVLGAADLPADDDGDRQDACVPQTGHLGASTCINLHQFASIYTTSYACMCICMILHESTRIYVNSHEFA
jgi:hypothetical protein